MISKILDYIIFGIDSFIDGSVMFSNMIIDGIDYMFCEFFCDHDFEFEKNLFGDSINFHNGKRSMFICKKCGKVKFGDELVRDDNGEVILDKETLELIESLKNSEINKERTNKDNADNI